MVKECKCICKEKDVPPEEWKGLTKFKITELDVLRGTLLHTWAFAGRTDTLQRLGLNTMSSEFMYSGGSQPAPGINCIITITNDDAVNNMVGYFNFETVLRRLT